MNSVSARLLSMNAIMFRYAINLCNPWTFQGSPGCSSGYRRSVHTAGSGDGDGRLWTSHCSHNTLYTGYQASSIAWDRCPKRYNNHNTRHKEVLNGFSLWRGFESLLVQNTILKTPTATKMVIRFDVITWLFPSIISFNLFSAVRSCTAVRGSWLVRGVSIFLLPSKIMHIDRNIHSETNRITHAKTTEQNKI